MNEHELVVLKRPLPAHGLAAGDVGTIVHVYRERSAFEVEFTLASGQTVAVLTLSVDDVRPRDGSEILHSRSVVEQPRT